MAASSHARGRLLATRRRRRLRKLWFEPLESRRLLATAEIAVFDRALNIPDGATVDFGLVPPNQWHGIDKTFTVQNTGNANLTLTLPSTMPPGFFITPPNPGQSSYTVQAGQQLTFDISMKDSADRNASGPISITTNDPDENPFDINLKGVVTSNPPPNTVWTVDDDANGVGGFNAPNWTWNQAQGYLGDVHTIPTSSSGGNQVASWEFRDLPNGVYRIWSTWPTADNRPTSVTYTVLDDQDSRGTHAANQRTAPSDLYADSVWWKELGDADIMNGILRVSVNAEGLSDNVVAADAIRLQRISNLTSIATFTIDDRTPDGSPAFSLEGSGWTAATGDYDNDLRTNAAGSGDDKARWTFNVSPGLYHAWATWYPTLGNSGAADAPFTVFDDQTPRGTAQVDQRGMPNDWNDGFLWWESLGGPYEITSLSTHGLVVQLADNAGGGVIADAVRVERVLQVPPVAGPEIEVWSGAMSLTDGGTLNFGSTRPGEAIQKPLTFKNVGSEPLDLTSLGGLPSGYSISPPFTATVLGTGQSAAYTLSLQANTDGHYGGTLSVGNGDGNENPFEIVLDGTVAAASGPDVDSYLIAKGRVYVQVGTGTPSLSADAPYFFYSEVGEAPSGSPTVNTATVRTPGGSIKTLVRNAFDGSWAYEITSKTSLDSSYAKGTYPFTINAVHDKIKTPSLTLPADAYPTAPHVTNWTESQALISSQDFTIRWDPFASGSVDDFIQLCIYGAGGQEVFCTPEPGEPGAVNGTATSAVIPANALAGNQSYDADLMFANVVDLNTTAYPGAIGVATYVSQTEFAVQTVVPPPPQGALQFEAGTYRAREPNGQVTFTVARTGGTLGEVQVDYATSDGSATAGSDYEAAQGTLIFPDGVTTRTLSVTLDNDDAVEGDETVQLTLRNPAGGAVLGTTATAVLTIADDEATVLPGTYVDSDGDSYTIKFSGPGSARIRRDADGVGRGPIESILLTGTNATSSLSITVKKATTGDGKVPIGQVAGEGDLKSLSAAQSDLTGAGLAFQGWVGQITLGDLRNNLGNTSNIALGGSAGQFTKITLGDVVNSSSIGLGAALSSLTARSIRGAVSLAAPAIGTLSTTAGPLEVDFATSGAVKSVSVKGGNARGDWQAASFGTISISGGGFEGDVRSTATAASLGKTAAIGKLTVSGGDFVGRLHALGTVGTVQVSKDKSGKGGSMLDTHAAAAAFGTFSIGKDLKNSVILAGANLGNDLQLDGSGADSDTFGPGSITKFSVSGQVSDSIVGAGLDPAGTMFHNGNDEIAGGTASKVGSFSIAGAAGAENYFRAGSWPKSVKVGGVTINPPSDARFRDLQNFADAGTTDEEGRVTLRLGGQPIQFIIQDQVSGQPIPGLVAGISTGTGTVGLGVLEVFDPMGQYPPRFVILHGAGGELAPPVAPQGPQLPVGEGEANLSIALSAEGEAGEAPIEVTLLEKALDAGSLIEALELAKYLPALKAPTSVLTTAGGLLEAFGYLAKAADQVTAGAVSRAVGSTDPTSPKPIRNADALAKIRQSANDGSMKSLFMAGLAGFGAGGPVGALTGVGLGLLATQLYRYLDEQTVINCPDGYLVESKLGNVQLYTCGATPAVTWTWPVTVETTLENGQPVSGGSLHLIGKDRLGEGAITEVGSDGTAAADVPEGDLQVNYFRPGRVPSAAAKTVPTDGGTLAMQASNSTTVATVTIQATPGITGLLSPGTQIQFSAVAQDQAGEVVPCSPTYEIFNPVGSNVATINRTTGLMTVNADPGAARVVAYCGAISSKPRLVSGMGAAAANLPVITISDTEVVEGNSGTTNCAFDLVVSKAGSQRIYVDYNSAYLGSAQPGLDYTDVTGKKELIFGQINRVNVPVRGDYLFEGDEQFALGLSNPVGARLDLKNSARCTIRDDDSPGIVVTPTAGLTTDEGGKTASFTVYLATEPSSTVTINLDSNDKTEGTVSRTSLAFDKTNWKTAQSITITGRSDSVLDGDVKYSIVTSPAVSADPNYNGLDPADVEVVNKEKLPVGSELWVGTLDGINDGGSCFDAYWTLHYEISLMFPGHVGTKSIFGGSGTFAGDEIVARQAPQWYVDTVAHIEPASVDLTVEAQSYVGNNPWNGPIQIWSSSPLIYQHVEWVVTGTATWPIYYIELEVDQGSATQLTGTWYDAGPGSTGNFSRGTFVLNKVAGIEADMTAPVNPATGVTSLTLDPLVQATLTQAVASWTAAGISGDALQRLAGMRVEITDLPASYLAAAGDRIYLDRDAAGYGWYVDATPDEHAEFAATSATAFRAAKTSPAAGRMDLLTVLIHELGHVLGRDDLDPAIAPDDIMAEVLQPGVRRVPWPAAVDAAFLAET